MNDFETVYLDDNKEVVVERRSAVLPVELNTEKLELMEQLLAGNVTYHESPDAGTQQIMTHEFIPEGLGEYY